MKAIHQRNTLDGISFSDVNSTPIINVNQKNLDTDGKKIGHNMKRKGTCFTQNRSKTMTKSNDINQISEDEISNDQGGGIACKQP